MREGDIPPGNSRPASRLRMQIGERWRDYLLLLILSGLLWAINLIWLSRDTRPPVWDMALHQTYALNYLPGAGVSASIPYWDWSGNYPPFVHLAIALTYLVFHPGPHIAVLANVPATVLLLWGVYELAGALAGRGSGRWACILTALTPYLIWFSRETVLDYWLSAWVVISLLLLWRTDGFRSRPASRLLGLAAAFGLLTKWTFAGFLAIPTAYVCIRSRIWKSTERMTHLADSVLMALGIAGIWYVPSLPKLVRYFHDNAEIGAREGEPAVFSFQSLIYYLRLLEGYQLFGLLFLLLLVSCFFAFKRRLFHDGQFWVWAIAGGWLAMTLLRTKDPRFTLPLLGPLLIATGAWLHSWGIGRKARIMRIVLVFLLCCQAYAVNFGIRWLPQEVVLLQGYQGSLRWDWNFYLQHYFHILGAPRREDWKQESILRAVAEDAARQKLRPSLALIPDLPRFNSANFQLFARLRGLPVGTEHLQSSTGGVGSFDGFDYAVITEREQGVTWTTGASRSLNQMIVDEYRIFRLMELYPLPNGDFARLYFLRREEPGGR